MMSLGGWRLALVVVVGLLLAGLAARSEAQEEAAPAEKLVAGQVVDEEGKPLAGATVTISSYRQRVETTDTLQTDDQGRFSYRLSLANLAYFRVRVESTDPTRLAFRNFYVERLTTDLSKLSFKMPPAKVAKVRVVDDQGKPVAGAIAGVSGGEYMGETALSDDSGVASILFPGNQRIEQAFALKGGLGFDYQLFTLDRGRQADQNEKQPEFPAKGIELKLTGAQPLEVTAREPDGTPIPNLPVYPWLLTKQKTGRETLNLSFFGEAVQRKTDAQGVARFDWIPEWQTQGITLWPTTSGTDFVHARGNYYPSAEAYQRGYGPEPVDPGSGRLVMTLERLVPISGKVIDPDGNPAAGVQVVASGAGYEDHDGAYERTLTDEQGRYQLNVAPNMAYQVAVRHKSLAAESRTDFPVWPDTPIDDLDFKLQEGTRITVRVTDEEGNPLAKKYVYMAQHGDYQKVRELGLPGSEGSNSVVRPTVDLGGQTNEQGEVTIVAGPGLYQINGPERSGHEEFTLTDEQEREFHFKVIQPKKKQIEGIVTAGDPPKPVAGAKLHGIPRTGTHEDWYATTTAEGTFAIEQQVAETWLQVLSPNETKGRILVLDREAVTADIHLEPAVTATGRVLEKESEEPLVERVIQYGVRVPSQPDTDSISRNAWGGNVTTDDQGRVTLERLLVGQPFDVSVTNLDGKGWRRVGKVTVEDDQPIDLGDMIYEEYKPYVPPTTEMRVDGMFKVDRPLEQRMEAVLADIPLTYQHVLVLLSAPDNATATWFLKQGYEEERLRNPLMNFRQVVVDISGERKEEALALAQRLGAVEAELPKFLVLVLDMQGNLITIAEEEDFLKGEEKDQGPDLEQTIAWITTHSPPPLKAREILDSALADAEKSGRRVIVQETATWCGPCILLSRYLTKHRALWERDYLWVKLDHRWEDTRDVVRELRGETSYGIPWWAILNAEGETLVTSIRAGDQNIGFPSSDEGKAHFREMLQATAVKLQPEQIEVLIDDLK